MTQAQTYSMPGMVYTPVELGTIRLGRLEERQGKPVPVKDDQFTITRLVRQRGEWIRHPLHDQLLNQLPPPPAGQGAAERKLREIPIRVMYDSPDLTVRSRYEAFDVQRKRPVCASTSPGQARRLVGGASDEVPCVGPEQCAFAQSEGVRCKLFGRITVQIAGQDEADNGFILRSTSINTLRNFESKLRRYWALFGQRLTGVPFRLVLRAKTTAGSFWRPFYFCDLELARGVTLQQAVGMAKQHAEANQTAGLEVAAWEDVVRSGLANGALAAGDLEAEMMNEFFHEAGQGEDGAGAEGAEAGPEPALHATQATLAPDALGATPGVKLVPLAINAAARAAHQEIVLPATASAEPLERATAPATAAAVAKGAAAQASALAGPAARPTDATAPRRLMPPGVRPVAVSQLPPRKKFSPPAAAGAAATHLAANLPT